MMNTPSLLITCVIILLLTHCRPDVRDKVSDTDGNVYKTIAIGGQVWMAENLRVTHYRNGDAIPHVYSDTLWGGCSYGAYCDYNNDTAERKSMGLLYNWYTVTDERNLAPEGWRIPTIEDWQILFERFGGENHAATMLKMGAMHHWLHSDTVNQEQEGFSYTPAGYRHGSTGSFHTRGSNGYYWSIDESIAAYSWSDRIYSGFAHPFREESNKNFGFAVRCIKE